MGYSPWGLSVSLSLSLSLSLSHTHTHTHTHTHSSGWLNPQMWNLGFGLEG